MLLLRGGAALLRYRLHSIVPAIIHIMHSSPATCVVTAAQPHHRQMREINTSGAHNHFALRVCGVDQPDPAALQVEGRAAVTVLVKERPLCLLWRGGPVSWEGFCAATLCSTDYLCPADCDTHTPLILYSHLPSKYNTFSNKKAIAFHSGASLYKKLTFGFKFTFNGEIVQ